MKRILVTPNNINFPGAHYAFYFSNSISILQDDSLGIFLSNEIFGPNIPHTNMSCFLSFLPNSDYNKKFTSFFLIFK